MRTIEDRKKDRVLQSLAKWREFFESENEYGSLYEILKKLREDMRYYEGKPLELIYRHAKEARDTYLSLTYGQKGRLRACEKEFKAMVRIARENKYI